jgi:hypothetical protein
MSRLASGERKVMYAVMVAGGHQPKETKRLNMLRFSLATSRHAPDYFVAIAHDLRLPAGLGRQNRGVGGNHAGGGFASAPRSVDLHSDTNGLIN